VNLEGWVRGREIVQTPDPAGTLAVERTFYPLKLVLELQ
jgi:hypothetical protein